MKGNASFKRLGNWAPSFKYGKCPLSRFPFAFWYLKPKMAAYLSDF
jgi:hypothetical protein